MSDEENASLDAPDRPAVRRRARPGEDADAGDASPPEGPVAVNEPEADPAPAAEEPVAQAAPPVSEPVAEVAAPAGEPVAEEAPAAPAPVHVVVRDVPHPSQVRALDQLLAQNPDLLADTAHEGDALEATDLADAAAVAAELALDFAAMFAAEGGMQQHKPGDRVTGRVVSITDNEVYVDVGAKSEAWINRRELSDPAGNLSVAVGDELKAQVVQVGESIRLSYGALQANLLTEALEEAADAGLPVEGRVDGFNEGGLEVRIGTRRAFCPRSQVDRGFVNDDLSIYVGKKFRFLVTKFDPTGRNIKVSRRALLEVEARDMAKETRDRLEVGAVLDGTVRKIMPFGVFVDLGGIDGMVHVSEISWERVEDPATVVQAGQPVRVKVLKIDAKRDRIALSMKQAAGDPWKTITERFESNKTYTGKVTRLADFGAFVALESGVEGLVHISEFDWNRRIKHPREMLEEGQEIEVLLLEVEAKKRRISLSIKQAGEDPWGGGGADVSVGDRLKVIVEKVAEFGIFATIAPGVTGLIPNSHMDTARGTNHSRMFKPGTEVDVQVIDLDKKRRKITLSRKALADMGAREDYDAYKKVMKEQQGGGESAFALAFKAAQERPRKG